MRSLVRSHDKSTTGCSRPFKPKPKPKSHPKSHPFSVQTVFTECTAEDLFHLPKEEILLFCGLEGNRLYSLLLVQKRRSNFNTNSEAQLRALLKMRKAHVDSHNEGDREPEGALPPSTSKGGVEPIAKPRASLASVAHVEPVTLISSEQSQEIYTVRSYR